MVNCDKLCKWSQSSHRGWQTSGVEALPNKSGKEEHRMQHGKFLKMNGDQPSQDLEKVWNQKRKKKNVCENNCYVREIVAIKVAGRVKIKRSSIRKTR